jgi:uncharacterized protein YdbL (DUF1318 family)
MITPGWVGWCVLATTVFLAACVTVNVNFPQEKLEGAAGRIEDMVRSPENPPPAQPSQPKKGPQGSLADAFLAALGPAEAAAQGRTVDVVPDIKVQTPELMRAINSRRGRVGEIDQLKARGCVGETNRGLIEARPGQGCPGTVGQLVSAENADREFIYRTLMQQNNIPASDAARVHAAFAKANRDRAKPGEWVQQDNGQWVKK